MNPFRFRGQTLPEDFKESIDRYVEHGVPTGGFLEAIIANDLREAVNRADERAMPLIPVIVAYLYNECPSGCWGLKDSFTDWIEAKRVYRENKAAGVQ